MMRTVDTHHPILLQKPADSWAGTYTVDDFPLDPDAASHDLARLDLCEDGQFRLQGKLNGRSVEASGPWSIQDAHLKLTDGAREFDYDITGKTPRDVWHGAHLEWRESSHGELVQDFRATLHQVPDPSSFQGPLRAEEQPMVGEMHLHSSRFGELTARFEADRTGHVEGTVDGKAVEADFRWMSFAPMTYLRLDGTDDFIGIHADHGPHPQHPASSSPHGEVDVNVCRSEQMGEYNMEMHFTPSHRG